MLRTQDRVKLSFEPEIQGTVTKVFSDGRFSVTWDNPVRKRGQARQRFTYPPQAAARIRKRNDSESEGE